MLRDPAIDACQIVRIHHVGHDHHGVAVQVDNTTGNKLTVVGFNHYSLILIGHGFAWVDDRLQQVAR